MLFMTIILLNKTGGNSKGIVNLNSFFEKPTIKSPPDFFKSNIVASFKIISGLQNNLQNLFFSTVHNKAANISAYTESTY
jgi:hypothetical protein